MKLNFFKKTPEPIKPDQVQTIFRTGKQLTEEELAEQKELETFESNAVRFFSDWEHNRNHEIVHASYTPPCLERRGNVIYRGADNVTWHDYQGRGIKTEMLSLFEDEPKKLAALNRALTIVLNQKLAEIEAKKKAEQKIKADELIERINAVNNQPK